MNILSFDTGYTIGYSIIDIDNIKLLKFGYNVIKSKQSIENFCKLTRSFISKLKFNIKIDKIVIEIPEFYGDKKGIISLKKGNLFFTYASAITIFTSINHKNKFLITPNFWKAQLSKKATQKRIKIILGDQINDILKFPACKSEHILDSVGMCLSQNKKIWNLL